MCFEFGTSRLWVDRGPTLSQAEVWLEVVTNDLVASSARLEAAGVVRCDDIEQPPDGMSAFWIASPAGIVHLVVEDAGASTFIAQ